MPGKYSTHIKPIKKLYYINRTDFKLHLELNRAHASTHKEQVPLADRAVRFQEVGLKEDIK
jgi:hypothetical protein